MTRPKRAVAQARINYAADRGSDEEEEEEIEAKETDSGDEDFGAATASSDEDEEDEEDLDEEEYLDDVRESLPKKRTRSTVTQDKQKPEVTGKGKGRARRGKLQLMVDLPVDIWFMIAEHLDPPSLLYLGRANKMMRSLFASKSKSQGLWNVVKRSVQLPELEATDLNDLALTSLLYERECHMCGANRAIFVDFRLRKRYCKPCRYPHLVLEHRLVKLIPNLTRYTVECSLYTASLNREIRRYPLDDTAELNEKILVLQAAIERAEGKKQQENANEALQQFIDSRKEIISIASRDLKKLTKWVDLSAEQRRAADDAACEARSEAIEAKLLELGHDERDVRSACSRYSSSVSNLTWQPAALTPQIWRKISAKVIEEVESSKQDRLEWETSVRRKQVKPYYEALREASNKKHLFLSFDIFATLPAVRALWRGKDSTVDDYSWQSALEEITAQIPQARRRIQLEFAPNLFSYDSTNRYYLDAQINIQDSSTISDQDLDTLLSRFTSTFHAVRSGYEPPSNWTYIYISDSLDFVWGGKYIVPRHWLRTQLSVLSQTGLADSEETEAQLQELGACFHCENCHRHTSRRAEEPRTGPFTWKEMSQHAIDYHSTGYNSAESSLWINYRAPTRRESPLNEPWSSFWNRALDPSVTG